MRLLLRSVYILSLGIRYSIKTVNIISIHPEISPIVQWCHARYSELIEVLYFNHCSPESTAEKIVK